MNLKIFGILGILAFATVSVVSWADDTEEVEMLDDEEFDEDEFEDDEEDVVEEEEEETRTVASRLSCDEIKKRITELRKEVVANPDLNEELETMLVRQRSQCASRARGRPVRNYENINPVTVIDSGIIEPETEAEVVEEEVKVVEPKPVKKTKKELEAEQIAQEQQIAENLAKGLCADGTKPNKYGCCPGEKFKEVSQMKFACCPEEGECVEPRKKK